MKRLMYIPPKAEKMTLSRVSILESASLQTSAEFVDFTDGGEWEEL